MSIQSLILHPETVGLAFTHLIADSTPKCDGDPWEADIKGTLSKHLLTLLGVAVLAVPTAATNAEETEWIEEIIVTAEKREENILEVPITMSAFNDRLIEELGITNSLDLEQLVPGLQFGSASLQQRSDGQGTTIRGIGTQSARELHSDLAVAVYVDGVYTVDTYGLAPNLFDVERVEVARGPQGTLNGRNSIAGSISFHSKRPTDTWDADVLAEFTDQTTQRYNVAFGGPITDSISFRINGGVYGGDGAQENTGIGKDIDEPDETTFSPQLRFKNDRFDINFKYLNVQDKGSEAFLVRFADIARNNPDQGNWFLNDRPMPSLTSCSNPPITGLIGGNVFRSEPLTAKIICSDLENKIASNRNGVQDSETDRYTLNFDWNITDTLTLRYTYGESETRTTASQDGDGTDRVGSAADPSIPSDLDAGAQVDCFDDGVLMGEVDCWTAQGAEFSDTDNIHAFTNEESSHELQLVSNFDGPLNFVVGYYIYENETFFDQGGFDYANPLRFVDADAAAVAASPIFGETVVTSCQSYLDDFFIPAFGDPATGIVFGSFGVGCPTGGDNLRSSSFFSSTTSDTKAAFANVEYQLTDEWNIAVGLRWTEDEKKRTAVIPADLVAAAGDVAVGTVPNSIFVGDFFGTGVPVVFTGSAGTPTPTTWDQVIGHVSLEYTPEDNLMYYGRISTGYRAGGFNWQFLDNKDSFDEEELTNYEVGVKGLFLDNRLQLTTGLFYQDFENYQLTANQPVDERFIDPTDSTFLREHTINVGSSTTIWGFEVEGVYYLTERWRISGYYNYLNSELGRHSTVVRADPDQTFVDYVYTNPGADPAGPDGVIGTADDFQDTNQVALPRDHTGDELPQMPNHKWAITTAYTWPLAQMGSVQFLGTWSYTGERWPQRAGNISKTKVPSYDRLDLRARWESADEQWSASLYVQNALDDIGVSESISIDLQGSLTEPRQVGLQVRWRPAL
jgi:iron complex outermembrane receptor protein